MRLLRFSPLILVVIFLSGMIILVLLSSLFLGDGLQDTGQEIKLASRTPSKGPGLPPVFAYWISGTGGEKKKILRLLKAVYHPRNQYLLHLDAGSSQLEREELALSVQSEHIFQAFGNVDVVGKGYAVEKTSSSAVASTLHGAAVLLKISSDWDWFIMLSPSDYPLLTQDDLLHAFTPVPRHLNFFDHSSELGWKENERFNKIVVDPSLYLDTNRKFFFASEPREAPDTFKIFTGSPWMILSRLFMEHCVHSWDNLPRKLLMYFTNVAYASEAYFQTVICNSPEFKNSTVNNDLRYFVWDDPPKPDPVLLNETHYKQMMQSGAAFARRFMEDDPLLQKIDKIILKRRSNGVGVGKWCSGLGGRGKTLMEDSSLSAGGIDAVKPGPYGKKLRKLLFRLLQEERLHSNQCKVG